MLSMFLAVGSGRERVGERSRIGREPATAAARRREHCERSCSDPRTAVQGATGDLPTTVELMLHDVVGDQHVVPLSHDS